MGCEKFIPGCIGCICSSAAEMFVRVDKVPMNTQLKQWFAQFLLPTPSKDI